MDTGSRSSRQVAAAPLQPCLLSRAPPRMCSLQLLAVKLVEWAAADFSMRPPHFDRLCPA